MHTRLTAALFIALVAGTATANEVDRQSLDDAWWTGPIVAAGAATLPQGHMLIEPYVYDAITRGRYDSNGNYRSTDTAHSFGSLTYMLYGVTDSFTAGVIPTFGFNDLSNGEDSSGIGVGDVTLQAQWRLSQFRESGHVPTSSLVLQQTLPTGKYDRLGTRPSDGIGAGAHTTSLAVHSQYYFWMPNGRILRTRLNIAYAMSDSVDVADTSVYGTRQGFRGHADPGDTFSIYSAWEYSATRNWVLALDVFYQHDDSTRIRGEQDGAQFAAESGPAWRLGLAPALEYNFNSRVGVIFGARWFAAGKNTGASVTPVTAINMVF
ncbi:MAG TPA: hypothetical protein VJS12_16165 [Steroidobacteraceae bacterium]|nr:hypothetical protein [Steroidobacteraceae bacterium]